MSQDYGQIPIPDSNSLLRENNTLRLTIDSLHEELQSLKFKSATPHNPFLETQLISLKSENQQLINERNHLIKQLQSPRLSETSPDGMGRLREKLESLLDENKRLGDMVIDLKQRNAHLETHQVNRSSSHYREDENNALQSKLALLATENERLNRLVQEREREIDSSVGNSSAKVVILELENKIVVLSAENERLNAVVNDRNREIETLQLKLSSMGSHHGQGNDRYEGLLSEIERLNHVLHDREREIEEYRVQRGSERYSHYSRGEGEKRAGRYDTESSHGGVDVDRRIREVEMQRDDLGREVDAWKEKYKNVLKETKQPEQYENEVKRLRGEVEKLKVSLEIKTKQLSEYESHHNKYLNAGDAEKKIDALVHENERVNTLLNEKKKEMAALQKRVEGYGGVEDKIIGLVTENQRIVKSLGEKTKECEIWREKYIALEGGDHANPLDVEKRVKAIETESDRTRGMYNEKTREIEGLKKRLREAGNQIESWKEKFYERDSAFLKHSQTNNRLEAKVKSMGEENEKLNKILEEKVKMISELQVKIYSVTDIEARAKAFTQERERLEALVSRQKDDLLQMTEKSVRLDIVDKRLKETEKQLSLLLKENEELKVMVRDREQEIAEGRNIIEELEDKTNKVYKLEEMLEILARDNEKNAMEIEDKKRETKEWKDKVKDLQGRNMRVAELETRIELMASENERVAGLLKRKEKMLEESQDLRGLSHQGGKRELEETVRWLAEENEGLKDDCERKGREVDMLKSRLETRERESLRRETGQSQVRASIVETENATLKQIIKEREEEIKRWRVKCETGSKYTEGERELLDKLRTLQSENGDLKGSVAEKNIVIQDIVRKNNELEEMQERFQRVASEKVLLSAEVERLREDVTLLRKEKELMERKELLSGRTSDYNALSSGKYNRSSDRTDDMGKMIDELVKENTKLESVIIRLERELEYHKKKSLEYEKVEVYLATLQGKLDLLAEENNRLTEKMKEYKDQSERLSQRLKEKDREIQGVSIRFGSSGEANYGYGHHLDSLHSEGDRFNALKSPTGGLDKGYSGLGIYESKSYGNADYGIKQYSTHKDSPSHLKNDKSNDNFRASRVGAAGDVAIDKLYTGMHSDSMKILQDANLDLLKQTLEQQEKDIISIRGSNIHVDKEYNFTGKNEGKSYDF